MPLAIVAVLVASLLLAWQQVGPGNAREREIERALRHAVADCGHTEQSGDSSRDEDGQRFAVTCGPADDLGQFVAMSRFDTRALADAGFRRQAADPKRALCRTSTEVFLLALFWPDGADPSADAHERAADRRFCEEIGAGTPRYADWTG